MASKKTKKTADTASLTDEIRFTLPGPDGPAKLLANAEIIFHTGILAGYRLEGFALWQAEADKGKYISVTVPSRRVGEKRYYEYLRTQSGEIKDMDRIKAQLVTAYRAFIARAEQASKEPVSEQESDPAPEKGSE